MKTPEEQAKVDEASSIFATHIPVTHRLVDATSNQVVREFCWRDNEPWPCKAILRARELTADLAEEVD